MRKSNALPGLDLLVGFEAAARHLSFTRAGEELHLTQSAVSRQIKELEDQLGVALFRRRHRAISLTEPGHQLYGAAAQVLTTMRTATQRLRAQSGRRRPLSVTTTNSFAALWLIPRLAGLTDFKPAATLSFSGYEQIIPAAIAGHGVALGRSPLVKDLLAAKDLVAPFQSTADPARAYFAIVAKDAAGRPEVAAFVEWLKATRPTQPPRGGRRRLSRDRKSTRLKSSHVRISHADFFLTEKHKY